MFDLQMLKEQTKKINNALEIKNVRLAEEETSKLLIDIKLFFIERAKDAVKGNKTKTL